jgi:predicted GH43/DUF377 family glycosyl hydrolase
MLLTGIVPQSNAQRSTEDNMSIDTDIVEKWSAFYQNWYYYPDFVVSASLEKDLDFTLVDGPNVYRSGDEWHMLYFGYDGCGYQSCLATSEDLVHWKPA